MAISALQPLENLNASHSIVLTREGSFLASHSRLIIFHDDLNYSHVKQTA